MYVSAIAARSSGGGFPGLAVGSLIALAVLLGGAALLIARPWERDSLAPDLTTGASTGVAIGDSVAVAGAGGPSIAAARIAPAPPAYVLSGKPVALAGSTEAIGVSSNRPVAVAPSQPTPHAPDTGGASEPLPPTPPAVSQPAQSGPIVVAELEGGPRGSGGGNGGPRTSGGVVHGGIRNGAGPFSLVEGHEYVLAVSFEIEESAFEQIGTENMLLRVLSDGAEGPSLGLQLWEFPSTEWYAGEVTRGLWSSGPAMGGDRLLAPVAADAWHELVVHLKASSEASGFYEIFLDGVPIDARAGVSLIDPESSSTQLEAGLFREGKRVVGTSEARFGAAKLTETSEPDLP
ncbi:MAG TPA: heparin lyase I family protein [Solirubrobacterales bacterium]